jgi:cytochrome c biogenesis protein CcmG/thiol:disulfide interchange protein DsbE
MLVRAGWALIAAAAIVSSALLAATYSGGGAAFTPVNDRLPRVHLANVIPGAPAITMSDFQSRAVVVNFWASWCGPCEQEIAAFQAVHQELGNQVVFVGIDENDTRSAAVAFLRHAGVSYANGFDENGAVGESFALPGTPSTFFVSDGRELDVKFGALSATVLRANIRQLFGV